MWGDNRQLQRNKTHVQVQMEDQLHPLDPLIASEIRTTSALINEAHPPSPPSTSWMFTSITAQEPPKALVLKFLANYGVGISIPRKSFTVLIDRHSGHVYEVVVNLSTRTVESFQRAPDGSQPPFTVEEEVVAAEKFVRTNPEVVRRCREYGYEMDSVAIDSWTFGWSGDEPECLGKRVMQFFLHCVGKAQDRIDTLPTGQPLKKIPVDIPKKCVNYDVDALLKADPHYFRRDLKQIQITQPEGPSFTVKGNEIQWQKFKFRISFNYREGLVLHNITYQDRPLIYRAAICELVVPYGDPRPPHHRKCAFDGGEAGFGNCANSLELGCDCLGTIKYFDGVLCDNSGQPHIIKNAVCLHEEDAGLLFKRTDFRTGKTPMTRVARSRRLVVSFIATFLNYDYAFYWYFYQDASIEFEAKSTGCLNTVLSAPGETPSAFGTLVSPGVFAQNHQHLFVARIDPMIDGVKNSVVMIDVQSMEEPTGSDRNPYGNGFHEVTTPLRTTSEAVTDACPKVNRTWRIYNQSSIHELTGQPVGWNLVPKSGQTLRAKPDSFVAQRASFARHNFWVTPYKQYQHYPAGFYCNNHLGGGGLAEWVERNENIEDTDIVVWHVFGLTHIPRVEDFPIMSAESCGFVLRPVNFFRANAALDVPLPWPMRVKNAKQ